MGTPSLHHFCIPFFYRLSASLCLNMMMAYKIKECGTSRLGL